MLNSILPRCSFARLGRNLIAAVIRQTCPDLDDVTLRDGRFACERVSFLRGRVEDETVARRAVTGTSGRTAVRTHIAHRAGT